MSVETSFKVLAAICFCYLAYGEEENFKIIDVGRPCQMKVELFRAFSTSVHAGRVKIQWYQRRHMDDYKDDLECDLLISGNYLYNRLAFQFEESTMNADDCVYLKQRTRSYTTSYSVITYDEYCGGSVPLNRIYVTKPERDLVLRFKIGSSGHKSLRMVFNVFRTDGVCDDDYECANGRCIPEDIECNEYNPCGDESECKNLTGWEIFGIVVGCLIGTILCCWCCCCRNSKKENQPSNPDVNNITNTSTRGVTMVNIPLNSEERRQLNRADTELEQSLAFFTQITGDENNSTPVYMHETVSNQSNNYLPPTYSMLNNTRTEPTNSQDYNVPSTPYSGTSSHYPSSPGHYREAAATYVAPSAPSLNENDEATPPPPSYDDVIAHGDKYAVGSTSQPN